MHRNLQKLKYGNNTVKQIKQKKRYEFIQILKLETSDVEFLKFTKMVISHTVYSN